jgi:hypothetical protein
MFPNTYKRLWLDLLALDEPEQMLVEFRHCVGPEDLLKPVACARAGLRLLAALRSACQRAARKSPSGCGLLRFGGHVGVSRLARVGVKQRRLLALLE